VTELESGRPLELDHHLTTYHHPSAAHFSTKETKLFFSLVQRISFIACSLRRGRIRQRNVTFQFTRDCHSGFIDVYLGSFFAVGSLVHTEKPTSSATRSTRQQQHAVVQPGSVLYHTGANIPI
jgi:hypothetical protein